MSDYTVSDSQLQQLNVMIDIGGHIPSAVSDALADAQIAQAGGNNAALTSALNRAIAANIRNGKAYSDIQGWHDDVKNSGQVTPPVPPGPSPGDTPVIPVFDPSTGLWMLPPLLPNTGNHSFGGEVGKRYCVQLVDAGSNPGFSFPSGPCLLDLGTQPGGSDIVANQGGADNVVYIGSVAAGVYMTFSGAPGHSSVGTVKYSYFKYAA